MPFVLCATPPPFPTTLGVNHSNENKFPTYDKCTRIPEIARPLWFRDMCSKQRWP
ncbi:hypothetical protein CGRA01v4_03982 [Colletotrichum graminicola]|nr:hypothetical protein CGRA01v4_03982 [Colletotrichum graminicola]